jgi:predicted enzyme related to lactoylglutathione lyase
MSVVHLELHTGDLPAASAFYSNLLGWRPEWVETSAGAYLVLGTGVGVVQCATRRPAWLPYVEVDRIDEATRRARRLGASVTLDPREGPAGWRSVVTAPQGGEIALWQPKERRCRCEQVAEGVYCASRGGEVGRPILRPQQHEREVRAV